MSAFVVGDVVRVGRACLGHPPGSLALVVEIYDRAALRIGEGRGLTLLFEGGAFDGFSPLDLAIFGVRWIGHAPGLARYRWHSAIRLTEDHRRGIFDAVWSASHETRNRGDRNRVPRVRRPRGVRHG